MLFACLGCLGWCWLISLRLWRYYWVVGDFVVYFVYYVGIVFVVSCGCLVNVVLSLLLPRCVVRGLFVYCCWFGFANSVVLLVVSLALDITLLVVLFVNFVCIGYLVVAWLLCLLKCLFVVMLCLVVVLLFCWCLFISGYVVILLFVCFLFVWLICFLFGCR